MRVLQQVREVEQEQGSDACDESPHGTTTKDREIFSKKGKDRAGAVGGVSDWVSEGSCHAKDHMAVHQVQLQSVEDRTVKFEQRQDEATHLEETSDGREGTDSPRPT